MADVNPVFAAWLIALTHFLKCIGSFSKISEYIFDYGMKIEWPLCFCRLQRRLRQRLQYKPLAHRRDNQSLAKIVKIFPESFLSST